jgi:hypothetical protein
MSGRLRLQVSRRLLRRHRSGLCHVEPVPKACPLVHSRVLWAYELKSALGYCLVVQVDFVLRRIVPVKRYPLRPLPPVLVIDVIPRVECRVVKRAKDVQLAGSLQEIFKTVGDIHVDFRLGRLAVLEAQQHYLSCPVIERWHGLVFLWLNLPNHGISFMVSFSITATTMPSSTSSFAK